MNALLSIKPEFAEKILAGGKRYEFRRRVFSDPGAVDRVIMYASAPVQRILGFFWFDQVIEAGPRALWNRFEDESGINDQDRFLEYFAGVDTGFAIAISEVESLADPVDPCDLVPDFSPPVSFSYVGEEFDSILTRS